MIRRAPRNESSTSHPAARNCQLRTLDGVLDHAPPRGVRVDRPSLDPTLGPSQRRWTLPSLSTPQTG